MNTTLQVHVEVKPYEETHAAAAPAGPGGGYGTALQITHALARLPGVILIAPHPISHLAA